MHCNRNGAALIGFLWLSWVLQRVLVTFARWFFAFCLAPWGIYRTNLKKYGPWAVVTGASEGIGRGYAHEFARQGLNVVIISRSKEKLQKVADEIKEKYKREVHIISVDFSVGQDVYPIISEQLVDMDIGVLVNNVGCFDYPSDFDSLGAHSLRRTIELNCQTTVQMTKLLIPSMVKRKRSIVVNVSSLSGDFSRSVYSASKCFVNNFSDGLRKEYASKGVIVQTVAPCIVATAMSGFKSSQTNFFVLDPLQYSRAALATIGFLKFTYGCFSHELQGFILTRLPSFTLDAVFKAMNPGPDKSE